MGIIKKSIPLPNGFIERIEQLERDSLHQQNKSLHYASSGEAIVLRQAIEELKRRIALLLEHLDLQEKSDEEKWYLIPDGEFRQAPPKNHRLEKIKRCKTCKREVKEAAC